MSKERFRYTIEMRYINTRNQEITIPSMQISYLAIDKDYDAINMPVIALTASIEKNILDDMIRNIDNNVITLGIYRYDTSNMSDNITSKYIVDRFIYLLPDDVSRTADLDYDENGEDTESTNALFRDVTIWLLQQSAVNNNRQSINGIYKNASMNSLILQISNYIGKVLMEPIKYDDKFDQVVIPPQDSISSYIRYLNEQLGVFYDTSYRFFIDFDMTYIVSSAGNIVKSRNQNIYTVDINITSIIPDEDTEDSGMYIDKKNNKYIVDVNGAYVNYLKNNITNKMVNKVTVVDSSGNVYEKDVDGNNIKVTNTINQIINLSSNNRNAINNIVSSIENNNIMISITKNDLDASLFTINKEYIITDNLHEEYNGRYLLVSNKQLFIRQSDQFIMCTILTFKKI